MLDEIIEKKHDSMRQKWEEIKLSARGLTVQYSSRKEKSRNNQLLVLQRKLKILEGEKQRNINISSQLTADWDMAGVLVFNCWLFPQSQFYKTVDIIKWRKIHSLICSRFPMLQKMSPCRRKLSHTDKCYNPNVLMNQKKT